MFRIYKAILRQLLISKRDTHLTTDSNALKEHSEDAAIWKQREWSVGIHQYKGYTPD
jgi:hypothetical protein